MEEIKPGDVLNKYWGYDRFRPLQEDIIRSVSSGRDTLALLPTGGGKSICFQVPALMKPGICIVVSPLIALMKDQVENLSARHIKAVAIFSGMSRNEVDLSLDNCIYGNTRFLYLSPERLVSEWVRERIAAMQVNLIAVDEAHCISQWGYDFRPPYLRIAEIRELHSQVPVLALTASATPRVQSDIMEKLHFRNGNIFRKSFDRPNLNYLSYDVEDKAGRMTGILKKTQGTAIVYVRNRKRTRDYAELLNRYGISADFYHAGLATPLRDSRQFDWKSGKTRVIVCTNAFGMGIDKPDVRTVIHVDLPDSLEAYYQEAGRAGRDEKAAYAIVLYNNNDVADLRGRQETTYPLLRDLKAIYQALSNFLQVPVDGGYGVSYDFDISRFIAAYDFKPIIVISALQHLSAEGLISVTDAVFLPSRVHFRIPHNQLYNFQASHPRFDSLIKTILRSSEGIFDDFARINESELANRIGSSYDQVVSMLKYLDRAEVIFYEPRKDSPQLVFTTPREDATYLSFDEKKYHARKALYFEQTEGVIRYVSSTHQCRSIMLLNYFGEHPDARCGHCDYCRSRNKVDMNEIEMESFRDKVLNFLIAGPASPITVLENTGISNHEKGLDALGWMVDQEFIQYTGSGLLEPVPEAK